MNNKSIQQHSVQLTAMSAMPNDEMLNRISHVTRVLHDSLSGLGLDKILVQVAHDIPDARDRLNYVARMTKQAAERVLNATGYHDDGSGFSGSDGASNLENH